MSSLRVPLRGQKGDYLRRCRARRRFALFLDVNYLPYFHPQIFIFKVNGYIDLIA
jgi:hypothetical protein